MDSRTSSAVPRARPQPAPRVALGRQCIKCGQPLTIQQAVAGEVCDDLACKGPYLQDLKALETAKRRAARVSVAEQVRGQLGIADQRIVVVPANVNRCVTLSLERLENFRHHLHRVIAKAQPPQDGLGETDEASEGRPGEELPQQTVLHACATCRGRCCLGGAGHAFLRADTITEFWHRNPSMSADVIEAEYLRHAAPRGVADSCVYHSDSGCTLPRDMRADICNTFLCEGLLEGLEEPSSEVFVAADGAVVHWAVLVESQGHRVDLLPRTPAPC